MRRLVRVLLVGGCVERGIRNWEHMTFCLLSHSPSSLICDSPAPPGPLWRVLSSRHAALVLSGVCVCMCVCGCGCVSLCLGVTLPLCVSGGVLKPEAALLQEFHPPLFSPPQGDLGFLMGSSEPFPALLLSPASAQLGEHPQKSGGAKKPV